MASPSVSTVKIPICRPSGTAQYQAGANRVAAIAPSTVAATVKEMMPRPSWNIRKSRSFQVAGSPRRD